MFKLLLALSMITVIAGCETIKGAGRDVGNGAAAVVGMN